MFLQLLNLSFLVNGTASNEATQLLRRMFNCRIGFSLTPPFDPQGRNILEQPIALLKVSILCFFIDLL